MCYKLLVKVLNISNDKICQVKDLPQDHMDMLQVSCHDGHKNYVNAHQILITFDEGNYVFLHVPKKS